MIVATGVLQMRIYNLDKKQTKRREWWAGRDGGGREKDRQTTFTRKIKVIKKTKNLACKRGNRMCEPPS